MNIVLENINLIASLCLWLAAYIMMHTFLRKKWENRGISAYTNWGGSLLISIAVPLVLAFLVDLIPNVKSIHIYTIFILATVLTLSSLTDISSAKVPKEPMHLATLAGLLSLLYYHPSIVWVNLLYTIPTLVILPFIVAFATRGGIGMGDIRILLATACTVGIWTDPMFLLAGFVIACILQVLITRIPALSHKMESKTLDEHAVDGEEAENSQNRKLRKSYRFTLILSLCMIAAPLAYLL